MCQSKLSQLQHNSVGTICTTIPEQIKVMQLEGYSQPRYNKHVHSAMMCLTVVGVIHMLTADKFVDHTNTPMKCCGKILKVQNEEMTHVTLTTPTQWTVSHHKANTSNGQPIYKI